MGSKKIRVLRLLQYTYDDAEAAALDMRNWTISKSVPGIGMVMKSATLPFDVVEDEDA